MIEEKDNLLDLAQTYLEWLLRDELDPLKRYLSLDFVKRQNVARQLKLIQSIPKIFYGLDVEAHLFEDYITTETDQKTIITPFQFEVTYTPHSNLVDVEKITITINQVSLDEAGWKIDSIITQQDEHLLCKMIEANQSVVV